MAQPTMSHRCSGFDEGGDPLMQVGDPFECHYLATSLDYLATALDALTSFQSGR
jgi:hypothetical protein